MTQESDAEFHSALFAHLIISLAQSAMLGLGKIVNPMTKKSEVNLEAAQQAIDLLDMLEVKTKGNLNADEQNMMKSTLSMLKLNYVETANANPAAAPADAAPAAEAPTPEVEGGKRDDEKVKFRKTYS
jgi:ribosomal protein L12E/L44/L45/RPP1/RPP2